MLSRSSTGNGANRVLRLQSGGGGACPSRHRLIMSARQNAIVTVSIATINYVAKLSVLLPVYLYHRLISVIRLNSSPLTANFHTDLITTAIMAPLYTDETPDEVKNAKGLHLLTMNTPNGQAVQILLEELKDVYGTEWTTTLIDIMTNEQKKDWFLRIDPNGMSNGLHRLFGTLQC